MSPADSNHAPLRFALIGDPVEHSLSPAMHSAAYEALRIDATYVRRRVDANEVGAALRELWDAGFEGLNVTVPHKLAVMESLESIDEGARAVGAVNTLVRGELGWRGMNTDAEGFVRSLPDAASSYGRALVLGAGGAARAVAYGLAQAGVEVQVSARREGAAQALREVGATTAAWPPRLDAPLVINATSASWHHGEALVKALSWERNEGLFVDLAYGIPLMFLTQAEAHGASTLDGLGMLVHQGALALETWIGKPAPVAVMQAALLRGMETRV